MQVQPYKSLGAKLFYLMSALVLLTIVGNSFQFFLQFKSYQTKQIQDLLQIQADRVKDQIESNIDMWKSQVTVALPTLRGPDGKISQEALTRFINANQEFVALEIFTAESALSTSLSPQGDVFTSQIGKANFEDKQPEKVWRVIKASNREWLEKRIKSSKKDVIKNIQLENISSKVDLQMLATAIRFDIDGSKTVVWAILTTWQNNLTKLLPKSGTYNSGIVDPKGIIFSSPDPNDLAKLSRFSGKDMVQTAFQGKTPSGFLSNYRNQQGGDRIGAYSRLSQFNLAVIVDQDAKAAMQIVEKTLVSTSLWAGLFILTSMLFSYLGASGITHGLRMVTDATSRIAHGDLKHRIPPSTSDEVGLLAVSVNNMSKKISALMQSQVEKARFEKELETAKMVQGTFFPKSDIKLPDTSVTGFYQPASECGGDLWGHFTIEEGVEFVFIADAMGHGAPAALVTAMAYSTTMTIADIVKSEKDFRDSPAKVLDRLNRVIYEAVRGTISMTFFASIIDTRNGTITYANAGHNFPVIMPLDGSDERLPKTAKAAKGKGHQPITLKLMGTPLGIDPNATYSDKSSDLKAGDKIFYFTDGLIECTSPKGEMIGRKSLLERIAKGVNLGPEEMKNDVVRYAFDFFATQPLADDITVVVAELSKSWQAKPAPKPVPSTKVESSSPPPITVEPAASKPQINTAPIPATSKKFRLPNAG